MAKKRKTLPAEFEQIVLNGTLAELQSVFDHCEINAYGGSWKGNALTFRGISEDFIHWAVAQGIDMNAEDQSGNLPIMHQAQYDLKNFKLLLELGADIEKNRYHRTPLCKAVIAYVTRYDDIYMQVIRALIESGANVNSLNSYLNKWITPLEMGFYYSRQGNISPIAKVANLLMDAGAMITPAMQDCVRKMGEDFEYSRADYDKEIISEVEESLNHLYRLFQVEPAPKRIMNDGVSPIEIKSVTWQEQFEELWSLLVPNSGHAPTIQGEIIRIIGKVRHEIMDNGACNWCKDYKKLVQALPGYFAIGNVLPDNDYKEVEKLAKRVSSNSEGEIFFRLAELAVKWVLFNPYPIELQNVDYKW